LHTPENDSMGVILAFYGLGIYRYTLTSKAFLGAFYRLLYSLQNHCTVIVYKKGIDKVYMAIYKKKNPPTFVGGFFQKSQ